MSTTLSNGYKKPSTGDRGNSFFKDLEDNIKRVNSHNHDGVNSAPISTSSLDKVTAIISKDDWGTENTTGANDFYQNISMPAGYNFDTTDMFFSIATTGHLEEGARIYPYIKKIDNSNYIIGVNDDTMDLRVVYV